MQERNLNEFIANNMRNLAKMSIHKLKTLLFKLKKSKKEDDMKCVRIIKAIIKRKKNEYSIIANKIAATKLSRRISDESHING